MDDVKIYEELYVIFEEIDKLNKCNKFIRKYKYNKIKNKVKELVNNNFSSAIIKSLLTFNGIIESKGILKYRSNKYGLHPYSTQVLISIKDNDDIESVSYHIKDNTFYIEFNRFSFSINDTNIKYNKLEKRWNEVDKYIKEILINTILDDIGQFSDLIVH